jgi:hypothetical protein
MLWPYAVGAAMQSRRGNASSSVLGSLYSFRVMFFRGVADIRLELPVRAILAVLVHYDDDDRKPAKASRQQPELLFSQTAYDAIPLGMRGKPAGAALLPRKRHGDLTCQI